MALASLTCGCEAMSQELRSRKKVLALEAGAASALGVLLYILQMYSTDIVT